MERSLFKSGIFLGTSTRPFNVGWNHLVGSNILTSLPCFLEKATTFLCDLEKGHVTSIGRLGIGPYDDLRGACFHPKMVIFHPRSKVQRTKDSLEMQGLFRKGFEQFPNLSQVLERQKSTFCEVGKILASQDVSSQSPEILQVRWR